MKKLTATLMLAMLLSGPAHAEVTIEQICHMIGRQANLIMTGRQGGMTLSQSLELINGQPWPADFGLMMRSMAMDAYQAPLMMSEVNKNRMITEFENKMLHACLSAIQ
jgi:hypothetical protein